jgi:N-acetylneuraminic acid mutarotase
MSLLVIPVIGGAVPSAGPEAEGGPGVRRASGWLSFPERVAAQRAIEQVYWNHRIWPAGNLGPKPSLDEVISEAQIRAKVDDYLSKSNALASLWGRAITSEQLQAEMERMAAHSRDPRLLREVFAALGNDPFVIAETLARQTLAERLIRNWYARDDRFHGNLRRKAEEALAGLSSGSELSVLGDDYAETAWKLASRSGTKPMEEGANPPPAARQPREVTLDAAAWQEQLDRLAGLFGLRRHSASPMASPEDLPMPAVSPEDLPLLRVSPLQEENGAFVATTLLAKSPDALTTANAVWPKRPFDAWWMEQSAAISDQLDPADGEYTLAAVTQTTTCTPDTWEAPLGDSLPSARQLHTAVWTGSEMIVWGGWDGSYLGTGGRYDPSTDTWVAVTTSGAPSARQFHTAVWTGTEMIIWGGLGKVSPEPNDVGIMNTGGRYNPSTARWVATPLFTRTGRAPSARQLHTAVWTGSEMIVWGGKGATVGPLNTGGRYDPSENTWVATTTSDAPSARYWHTVVWTGSEMIVWGGGGFTVPPADTGGRYDPSTDTWEATTANDSPSARYRHAAVWTGSEMIVWGGWDDSTYLNTGGRYDPTTNTWVAAATNGAPSARSSHTAVWTGSAMVVFGGGGDDSYVSTGGRYDPSTDIWEATTTSNAPGARMFYTAVWTGSEMIIWGGGGGPSAQELQTGGRYDLASDTWVDTTTSGAQRGRSGHTAVWTGSEMIVWGGDDGRGDLNTGRRYDPATNTWMATPTNGAPVARSSQTAVWTGGEMIVWGGDDGSSALNTGGRYNPTLRTWGATTTSDAPGARSSHTAVWTGSEMIIWGGDDGSSGLNTGGRYDPTADTWVETTTSGAPVARSGHTAVRTGCEMIVWGGWDGSAYLSSGGRYDLSIGTWVGTSTSDAPVARSGHTAVWTGSEMIVWGGFSGSDLSTGGRYDLSIGTWVGTSTSDAPVARSGHTAVWTGSEMIVWGGAGTSTGGRYDPTADTWVETTTSGTPTARSGHTAVWTGTEMIVWGGDEGQQNDRDHGGRYCVSACETPSVWYQDIDGDGDGTANVQIPACSQPAGFVATSSDCDDCRDTVYPDAPQLCDDGLNNDCRTFSWPDLDGTNEYDDDDDGLTECGGDCDDTNDTVYPDAPQICDYLNNDCSHPSWPDLNDTNEYDNDGDYWTECGGDCDETRDTVKPYAPQLCDDGLNNDCSHPSWPDLVGTNEYDDDDDSLTECGGDCDDTRDTVKPGAPQLCDDGLNNDCDHSSWPDLVGTNEYDDDDDSLAECGGDCDDTRGTVYPDAPQICDGVNNNCVDAAWPTPPADEVTDGDMDGSPLCADCDESNNTVYPSAPQLCDGINNDCDDPAWPAPPADETDDDGDGVIGCEGDNCPEVSNPGQDDFDDDGIGDACETGAQLADANLSGRVDGFDLVLLARAFGAHAGAGSAYDPSVDFDHDLEIGGNDLAYLAEYFGREP